MNTFTVSFGSGAIALVMLLLIFVLLGLLLNWLRYRQPGAPREISTRPRFWSVMAGVLFVGVLLGMLVIGVWNNAATAMQNAWRLKSGECITIIIDDTPKSVCIDETGRVYTR